MWTLEVTYWVYFIFFKDRFLCSLHKDISSYQLLRRFSSFIVTKDWDVYGGWYIKIYVCLTLYTGSVDLDLDFQNCFITFFLSPDVLNLINSENDTNSKFRIGNGLCQWRLSLQFPNRLVICPVRTVELQRLWRML